jgi:hypothetical protein
MKKIIYLIAICIAVLFTSCTKEVDSSLLPANKTSIKTKQTGNQTNSPTYHFVYVTWSSFGRAGLYCLGWGLCEFEGCFNCCTENGQIVDCPTSMPVERAGIIRIPDGEKEGVLTITLNPSYIEQANAISNELTLIVDVDIDNDGYIIHEGNYSFDSSVGNYGGYILNVTKK